VSPGRQHVLTGTIRLSVDRHDRHRSLTVATTALALTGLLITAGMAVFGLPPVDLHGPLHHLGIMDPFCGGTRAARLTAQGHLAQARTYNPLGILAVVGAAAVVMRSVAGLVTGRWVNLDARLTARQMRVLLIGVLGLIILLEIRQQQRADLLTARL
jgi:hypothetical protein